jgi:hypothetical protein
MTDETKQKREQDRRDSAAVNAAQQGASLGMRSTAEKISERKQNPNFLDELQKAKIDTERWDWIENEMAGKFAGAHILGNRSESYIERQDLLNMADAEIQLTERQPGRILRERPELLAVMQDDVKHPESVDMRQPYSQEQKRVIREAADVATTRQSLAVDGKGLDAVSKITSESQVRKEDEEEASGLINKTKGVFR